MKKNLFAVILMAASFITVRTDAQPPVPREPGPREPRGGLQAISAFTGKVGKLASNDDYLYDGFYLQMGTDNVLVKFAPRLAGQIVPVLKNGGSATVNGVMDYPPTGEKEIRMTSFNVNGQTFEDTPPSEPPVPPADSFVSSKGAITGRQTDREGRVNGLIVDNRYVLRVPPHIIAQLSDLAANGTQVQFTGLQKSVRAGEVSVSDHKIIRCRTIGINGQQYMVE